MDIVLERALASVVTYIQNNDVEGVKPYFNEIPGSFYLPSIYFPVPYSSVSKVTLSTYCITTNIQCWFMEKKDWDANARAVHVRDMLLLDECAIPFMEKDGTDTGKKIRVTEPEIKRIDEGIIQLAISLREYASPEALEQQKVQEVDVNFAWEKATRLFKDETVRRDDSGSEEC